MNNSENFFVYSMNSRVIWTSNQVFHIPVLSDLYRVHIVDNPPVMTNKNCYDFNVRYFHKFVQPDLIENPLSLVNQEEILVNHEKVKCYVRLKDYVNYSYSASLPPVFTSEADKISLLARSMLDESKLSLEQIAKHNEFIPKLFADKKSELEKRYLSMVHQIKQCNSLEEVKQVGYSIVFEAINAV